MGRPLIALLTDFGTRDHYVGTMKGVILGICPDASLVDLTHEIAPQDVLGGALELLAAAPFFPAGTVFLCVIDPGVGSWRRAIATRVGSRTFVGPDNGLLSLVAGHGPAESVELSNERYALSPVSRTFEGRDRFAPAAAWLATGVPLTDLGPRVTSIVTIDLPAPRVTETAIEGEVLRVDRFGNLVTNIDRAVLERLAGRVPVVISIEGRSVDHLAGTFAEIHAGELGALIGSTGHLEIVVAGGNAAQTLGRSRGTPVHVSRRA